VAILRGQTRVIDLDLRAYFDNVRHHILVEKVARRIQDEDVMRLLKMILKATGEKGVPQGGVISPLLSNVYLNEVDRMLEKAKAVTRNGEYVHVEYARFADDRAPRRRGREVYGPNRRACCTGDEGRPLGLGRQSQGPNHRKLLRHNGRGGERSRKRQGEPVR
jgi:hypothetical protein